MSTQALEVRQPKTLAVTEEQRALALNTVAQGLTPQEFELFLYDCQRQGVHPLDRLLIPVIHKDDEGKRKLSIWTTIDMLRSRAAESGEYAGSEDAQFEEDSASKLPISATVSVWRFVQGQRCMFTATARWSEYFPGDKRGFMWKSKSHVMLGKCAEALALRKAFPKELAGMYAGEEMEGAEDAPPPAPEIVPVKVTRKKSEAPAVPSTPISPSTTERSQGAVQGRDGFSPQHPGGEIECISDAQRKRLLAIQGSAEVSDDKLKDYMVKTFNIVSRSKIPKRGGVYEKIINFLDPEFKFHPEEF